MQTNICLWWFQTAMKYFSFMKKPGGQDVPVILTPILLLAISPKRLFLKRQKSHHYFQKSFRTAKGYGPCRSALKDKLCPSEQRELAGLTISGLVLAQGYNKTTLGRSTVLGFQNIDQNFHILEWAKTKHRYIAQKSHYFNEAFILIV